MKKVSRRRSRAKMGLVIFATCTVCLSSCESVSDVALPDNNRDDNHDFDALPMEHFDDGDSLLEVIHDAITEASQTLHHRERNTQSRWGHRLKKWKRSIAKMLTSSSAVSHYHNGVSTTALQERSEKDNALKPATTQKQQRPRRITADTGDMFDYEMHEGARLISASFGLVSNTFGLLADGVRITGDTAAGFVGSSVRLMGTTVKSVSGTFESAGRALEPKKEERRKVLTSERLRERQLGKDNDDDDFRHGRILTNARGVASQSVRLVGNVVRGIGDVMLLAGEATETIASSTTGVAEDVVRIVEDFAGSVSSALSPHERRVKAKVKIDSMHQQKEDGNAGESFVTFGSYAAPSLDDTNEQSPPAPAPETTWRNMNINEKTFLDALEFAMDELWKLVAFAMADTQGVPSFAGELLGVLLLCYMAALWVLSSSTTSPPQEHRQQDEPARQTDITHVVLPTSEDEVSELSDPHESTAPGIIRPPGTGGPAHNKNNNSNVGRANCCSWFLGIVLFPFKTFLLILRMARRAICNKLTLLLVLYGGAWMYLCRASQLRSMAIQRNAAAYGYRSALDSLGSSSLSVAESVAWLNALLNQIWRVPYDPDSDDGLQWLKKNYPKFVRRSIRSNTYGRLECRSCDWEGSGTQLFSTPACLPYGGLEPYISGKIGTLVLEALGASRARRNDVAYASLYSFTLGRTPPLLRSIEFLGASAHDRNNLHFNVEVDAILEDLSLVLEVKLSSLEYALLPSTKVSVHAIDVTLPLKVAVSVRPDYPYISTVQLSLSEAPECNVRITPLSGESGLRGVDVGSLPVIREWVKDAIRVTLTEYVTPKYISIDIASWINSNPVCQQAGIPTRSLADITELRQKTRELLNTNPRTASPAGVAITSIADTMLSHRSTGSGTAFVQDGRKAAFDPETRKDAGSLIIKPTTELSRLGMDRFIEKLRENEVKEMQKEDGFVDYISKPLAIVTPFVVAIAASMFTDRLTKQKD